MRFLRLMFWSAACLFFGIAPLRAQSPDEQREEPLVLPEGIRISLELTAYISTRNAKPNDRVRFQVASNVLVESLVVIPKGAVAWGIVTLAKKPRPFSRDGRLEIALQSVTLLNGQTVAICSPAICKQCGKWDWRAPDSLQAPLLSVLAPVMLSMMPKEDRQAVLVSMVSKGNHIKRLPGTPMVAVVSRTVELNREEFFSLQPLTVGKEHELR